MSDPNHQIVFQPTRPDFVIQYKSSTSPYRSYSETRYEVISRRPIDKSGWKCLDACGLLGVGQGYEVESTETFTEAAPAVNIDKRTGLKVDGPVIDWQGREITSTTDYEYHRYIVKRILDSGD